MPRPLDCDCTSGDNKQCCSCDSEASLFTVMIDGEQHRICRDCVAATKVDDANNNEDEVKEDEEGEEE